MQDYQHGKINLFISSDIMTESTTSHNNQTDHLVKTLHNFKSMADLLETQETTVRKNTSVVTSDNKLDEIENSVQTTVGSRRNGFRNVKHSESQGEHMQFWCSRDINMKNSDIVRTDIDVESLHSVDSPSLGDDGNMRDDVYNQSSYDSSVIYNVNSLPEDHDNDYSVDKFSESPDIDNFSDNGDHDVKKSKRKQSMPKPRDILLNLEELPSKVSRSNNHNFQQQLNTMQDQLKLMQEKLLLQFTAKINDHFLQNQFQYKRGVDEIFTPGQKSVRSNGKETTGTQTERPSINDSSMHGIFNFGNSIVSELRCDNNNIETISTVARILKEQLTEQISLLVETVIDKTFRETNTAHTRKNTKIQQTDIVEHNLSKPQDASTIIKRSPKDDNYILKNRHITDNILLEKPSLNFMKFQHKPPQHIDSFGQRNTILDSLKLPPYQYSPLIRHRVDQQEKHETNSELSKSKINITPYYGHNRNFNDFIHSNSSWFPPLPFHPYAQSAHGLHTAFSVSSSVKEQEQTEAIPLIVNSPKKKRTKVTDTRLSPRAARALLQEPVPAEQPIHTGSLFPATISSSHVENKDQIPVHNASTINSSFTLPTCLPTSVAIPNPSLQQSDLFHVYANPSQMLKQKAGEHNDCLSLIDGIDNSNEHFKTVAKTSPRSGGSSPSTLYTPCESPVGKEYQDGRYNTEDCVAGENYPITSTLTPMHLRKAKLMFFFVRYPSSSILKVFFPDVKFNKNNTAQLVKWFSNFREFYYIQMEKYARQALGDGIKVSEELIVNTDSELYRVLNLHYNRNNQLEIPENFRIVVQATLREFFKAIQINKDAEQSWKKPIYKVIARMDDAVPDYFKSPNWMEQLNDV